jgi:hypothetical protein
MRSKTTQTIALFLLFGILTSSFSLRSQETEKPSGKFSGVFYMDYYYNVLRDTGITNYPNTVLKDKENVHGFQIRRIYFTYDYKVNSKLSSKFRLESDEANFTTNLAGNKANKFGMFVKDAHVKWNYYKSHEMIVGIQGPPSFEISEKIWGNRYIEKTIMDVRGICSSRDLGIGFKGKLTESGRLKYWVMLANGNPSTPENNKFKRYYGHLEILPLKDLTMTLYADYHSRQNIADAYTAGAFLANNVITTAFFAGYQKKDMFSISVEAFYRIIEHGNKLTDSYVDASGFGLSIFGTYHFSKKINAFARYDIFEPNTHKEKGADRRDLLIAGCAYKPADNFIISPNIYVELLENPTNQVIENSITPRLTLSWTF